MMASAIADFALITKIPLKYSFILSNFTISDFCMPPITSLNKVVTSNISDKYLQGLLIGYVSEVTVDANNLTRSGYIIPATDFHELNEVLVITTTKKDLIDKKE